jgi:translation initiation factor IF-3
MEVFTIASDHQINEQIRDRSVRVVAEDGEQLGVMSSQEAMAIADEKGLDLVKL